ncbi:hypothetical protein [Streptomyces sp. NPDC051016]|uniref:hypothetical protein n=1 Tax=Streptomyces sp. NPDC051016 TaxID=3365638 RepID=UPI00379FAE80
MEVLVTGSFLSVRSVEVLVTGSFLGAAMEYWEVEIAAFRRLIAAHPDEFSAFLAEEERNATITVPAGPCSACKRLHLDRKGIELAAHLGHDRLGHRTLHALWDGGYRTVRQVREASDQELRTLEGLRDAGIGRVRTSLRLHDLVHAHESSRDR